MAAEISVRLISKYVEEGLADPCQGGSCPAVFETDRNTVVVQGWTLRGSSKAKLREAGVCMATSEDAVELPKEFLLAALRQLEGG